MTFHTLNELIAEGVRGRYVLVRSDLNVPLDGSTVTDDGRIKASLPVISRSSPDAGARVLVTAHLGRPKGAPEAEVLAQARRRPAGGARPRSRSRWPRTRSASRPRSWPPPERRRSAGPGKRALRRPGDQQGRRRARRLRGRAGGPDRGQRRVRGRRLRRRPPQARQRLRRRHAGCPPTRATWCAPSWRCCSKLTTDTAAALRRGARRLQGLRQARGHRQPDRQGGHHPGGRRHAVHLPGRAGSQGRRAACWKQDQIPVVQDYLKRAAGGRNRLRAAHRRRGRGQVRRGRGPRDRPGRRHRGQLASAPPALGWTSDRRPAAAFAERDQGRQDRVLERAHGRVRVPGLRRGHPGHRAGAGRNHGGGRLHRRRRRRLRRSGAHPWLRGRPSSATFPPAAAPAWSSWKARNCPA